jgi:hypothetical protein
MRVYQIVFSFLDPSKAMGTIMAESEEEAISKLKSDIEENSPGIGDIEIISVEEVLNSPGTDAEDVSSDRTLN